MTETATKQQPEAAPQPVMGEVSLPAVQLEDAREWQAEQVRLLWRRRRLFFQVGAIGLLVSTSVAFMIPKSYKSTTQLMPPDPQSTSGIVMMAAMAAKAGGGLGTVAGDLPGLKSSGALFIGVLRSQTLQDRLIDQFDLRKIYGKQLVIDARTKLDENTSISEDRKSGIITISVTDYSPQRAAAIANAYVDELNSLVSDLSTSSAHRERVFLEERLQVAKQDLADASNQLAQFSSKNNTLDIQTEGKAMLDAAGSIAGQVIAAQSELEGLRQLYTDNNARVRTLNARVLELRKQLQKLGGTAGDAAKAANSLSEVSNGMPYPTIRSLPLLGAKYADYYRRAKIQETVFGLLTEQYELAKVQEVKETPTVKVLDPAQVPEKKSFPPRMLIMFLGTFLFFSMSVVWVFASGHWHQADPDDPRKILAQEVVATLKARTRWFSRNGAGPCGDEQKDLDRLDDLQPQTQGPMDR